MFELKNEKIVIDLKIYILFVSNEGKNILAFDTDILSFRITQNRLQLLSILLLFCKNKQLTNMLISHTAEKYE